MVTLGYLAAKSSKFFYKFFFQIYGHHFEYTGINGTCFPVPIGFMKFSISPEFTPLVRDKDFVHKIFVSLHGIKQELCAKSFQVNDMCEPQM